MKPHISKWDQFLQMRFFSPKNENVVKTRAKLVNRVFVDSSGKKKTFQVSKYTKICSNHFEYGRPVEPAPDPTIFLKGYGDDAKVGLKRKAPTSRKEPKKQLQEIPSDPEHLSLSPFSSSRVEEPTF